MKTGFKNSIMLKVFVVAVVALLLLIPTSMISDLIAEREYRRYEVIAEVSSKWGSEQILGGPILTVPFLVHRKNKDDEVVRKDRYYAHFTPEDLMISGNVGHELRKRGIYEVILYSSDLKIEGIFKKPDFNKLDVNPDEILWQDGFVSVGIPDLTGLKKKLQLNWLDKKIDFNPGIPTKEVYHTGIHVITPVGEEESVPFSFDLVLQGSNRLAFAPVGQNTEVSLESLWPDPSFDGDFLPNHNVTQSGFTATWNVIDLNRNLPDQWVGNSEDIYSSNFGVTMYIPANEYQKNTRTSKYALLIISLTFMTFFLSEVIKKNNLHPFHYILAGLALVVFYILLLSFTEHLGFGLAYLISATGTAILIVAYISAIIKSRVFTTILGLFFILVYSFIYVILQLQDFSLLVGALGLFAALAVTMYLTRNIDWYTIGKVRSGSPVSE